MKLSRIILSLAAGSLLFASACSEVATKSARPNVVLISIDSLRSDHLGCYGYERNTSPTIDRLAGEGARFANALSTTSWTLPAHASMFTGLLNQSHGVIGDNRYLVDEHVTLAEVLRDGGYQTAGFYGAPYLHPTFGMDQGFDAYESSGVGWRDIAEEDFREKTSKGQVESGSDITGPRTVAAVAGWLENLDEGPFFLFVHLWDVHFDYNPPEHYVELFDPDYAGDLDASGLHGNPSVHAGMDPRDLEHLIALYDGEIRFTDDSLDQILKLPGLSDRLDNTILIVTADHGEEFFEHGHKDHRNSLFDEVLRIPLIVRWPGHITSGRVVKDQVQIVDIFPTLLSMAGIEIPVAVQGRDLSGLLAGETLEPVDALSQLGGQLVALRTNEYKLIQRRERAVEFRLERDPGELAPLAPREHARERLAHAVAEAVAFRGGMGARAVPPRKEKLAPEIREQLRSLGYIEGSEADR